ncbi:hypothetical protein AAC387_Pa06g2332 [Persea americana]
MAQDGQQFSDGARNTPRLSATSSKTLLPRETSTVENPGKAPSRFWFLEQLQLLRKHFDSLPQPQGQSQTDSPAPQIQKSYVSFFSRMPISSPPAVPPPTWKDGKLSPKIPH